MGAFSLFVCIFEIFQNIILKYTLQNLGGGTSQSFTDGHPQSTENLFPSQERPFHTGHPEVRENKDMAKGQEKQGQEPSWRGDR